MIYNADLIQIFLGFRFLVEVRFTYFEFLSYALYIYYFTYLNQYIILLQPNCLDTNLPYYD